MSAQNTKAMDEKAREMILAVSRHAKALAREGDVKRHAKGILDTLRNWAFEEYGVVID